MGKKVKTWTSLRKIIPAIIAMLILTLTGQTGFGDEIQSDLALYLSGLPGNGMLNVNAAAGNVYDIAIIASKVSDFSGMEIQVEYDSTFFTLEDACLMSKAEERSIATLQEQRIKLTKITPGVVHFSCTNRIQAGSEWSGTVNIIRLRANRTGSSLINISSGGIIYASHDLTRDGKTDSKDLGCALLYTGWIDYDPGWLKGSKVKDSHGVPVYAYMVDLCRDGEIDMLDLIFVYANYTDKSRNYQ